MPKITFIQYDGTQQTIDASNGKSLMQNAVDNLVPGIIGDCGGCCNCATCHGYVEGPWAAKIPTAADDETMMLEGALSVEASSRLTCQIIMTDALDGIVVRLPESQV